MLIFGKITGGLASLGDFYGDYLFRKGPVHYGPLRLLVA